MFPEDQCAHLEAGDSSGKAKHSAGESESRCRVSMSTVPPDLRYPCFEGWVIHQYGEGKQIQLGRTD